MKAGSIIKHRFCGQQGCVIREILDERYVKAVMFKPGVLGQYELGDPAVIAVSNITEVDGEKVC